VDLAHTSILCDILIIEKASVPINLPLHIKSPFKFPKLGHSLYSMMEWNESAALYLYIWTLQNLAHFTKDFRSPGHLATWEFKVASAQHIGLCGNQNATLHAGFLWMMKQIFIMSLWYRNLI